MKDKKPARSKKVVSARGKFWFYRHVEDYLRELPKVLFPEKLIRNHKFYSVIIRWVLQEKRPIFFHPDTEAERVAFTGPYQIIPVPKRSGNYLNESFFTLFMMHEFVHNLSSYAKSIRELSAKNFADEYKRNERLASNATEVLIYYDIPQLREKVRDVLSFVIWYDVLVAQGHTQRPNVQELDAIREAWLENECFNWLFNTIPGCEGLLKFMDRWRNGNDPYWKKYLRRLLELSDMPELSTLTLNPLTYEAQIRCYGENEMYSRAPSQLEYERAQLHHVRLLYAIRGRKDEAPRSFAELLERVDELDEFTVTFE